MESDTPWAPGFVIRLAGTVVCCRGATERWAVGRDVTGQEAITIAVSLTVVRRILWSPL